MGFYDKTKAERDLIVEKISKDITDDLLKGKNKKLTGYFSDEDTYIRKAAYLVIGKLYHSRRELQKKIIDCLIQLQNHKDFLVRQAAINSAGEIGKSNFEEVEGIFERGLFDHHHSPRNAVIGSIKKMGEANPRPVLKWAKKYLHHDDKEIRREICHGIELRGRTHPEDILPLLKELQHDKTARVRKTLVHVIGQISYKEGCLETVIDHLKTWENYEFVNDALIEIIDVHHRYKDFAVLTPEEAENLINRAF